MIAMQLEQKGGEWTQVALTHDLPYSSRNVFAACVALYDRYNNPVHVTTNPLISSTIDGLRDSINDEFGGDKTVLSLASDYIQMHDQLPVFCQLQDELTTVTLFNNAESVVVTNALRLLTHHIIRRFSQGIIRPEWLNSPMELTYTSNGWDVQRLNPFRYLNELTQYVSHIQGLLKPFHTSGKVCPDYPNTLKGFVDFLKTAGIRSGITNAQAEKDVEDILETAPSLEVAKYMLPQFKYKAAMHLAEKYYKYLGKA